MRLETLVCLPAGSTGKGASCVADPWSCEEGLICVGGVEEKTPDAPLWAACLPACGSGHGTCGVGEDCRHVQDGKAFCFPMAGNGAPDDCGANGQCGSGALCVPTSDGARCLQTCLPGQKCADQSSCAVAPISAMRMCVPDGLSLTGAVVAPW